MSLKAYTSGSTYPELKKDTLRLYSSRLCPWAERARLVLAYKNIPHEKVNIELKDKPEWFLTTSPGGKVPVIQKNDIVLNESSAVSEYLDDVYPGERLQEDDPYKKAKDRILLENLGQVGSKLYLFLGHIYKGKDVDDVEDKTQQLFTGMQYYEDELARRGTQFFGGDKPKMIDLFLWPQFERIRALKLLAPQAEITKDKFPKISSWFDAMIKVPAIKQEMFTPEQHFQMWQLIKEGKSITNFGLE